MAEVPETKVPGEDRDPVPGSPGPLPRRDRTHIRPGSAVLRDGSRGAGGAGGAPFRDRGFGGVVAAEPAIRCTGPLREGPARRRNVPPLREAHDVLLPVPPADAGAAYGARQQRTTVPSGSLVDHRRALPGDDPRDPTLSRTGDSDRGNGSLRGLFGGEVSQARGRRALRDQRPLGRARLGAAVPRGHSFSPARPRSRDSDAHRGKAPEGYSKGRWARRGRRIASTLTFSREGGYRSAESARRWRTCTVSEEFFSTRTRFRSSTADFPISGSTLTTNRRRSSSHGRESPPVWRVLPDPARDGSSTIAGGMPRWRSVTATRCSGPLGRSLAGPPVT
jgi:hypothetical protein